MKLFYLDYEHGDYVVMAADLSEAWAKLKAQCGIIPCGLGPSNEGEHEAYNDMFEVETGDRISNPNDLTLVF